jgi:hypothetical protein
MKMGTGLGVTLATWSFEMGHITEKQYKDYLLSEKEYPLPEHKKDSDALD